MKELMMKIKNELDQFNDDIQIGIYKHTYGYEIELTIDYCFQKRFNKLNKQINDFLEQYINENEIQFDNMYRHKFSIFGAEYYRHIKIIISKDKKKSGYKK